MVDNQLDRWRDGVERTLERIEKKIDDHIAKSHGNPGNPHNPSNSLVTKRNAAVGGGFVGLIALAQVLREIFLGG